MLSFSGPERQVILCTIGHLGDTRAALHFRLANSSWLTDNVPSLDPYIYFRSPCGVGRPTDIYDLLFSAHVVSDSAPRITHPCKQEISVIGVGHFFSRVFHSSRSTTARYVSFISILLPNLLAENTFNTPHPISNPLALHHARVFNFTAVSESFLVWTFSTLPAYTNNMLLRYPSARSDNFIELKPHPRNLLVFRQRARRGWPSYPTVCQTPSPRISESRALFSGFSR